MSANADSQSHWKASAAYSLQAPGHVGRDREGFWAEIASTVCLYAPQNGARAKACRLHFVICQSQHFNYFRQYVTDWCGGGSAVGSHVLGGNDR